MMMKGTKMKMKLGYSISGLLLLLVVWHLSNHQVSEAAADTQPNKLCEHISKGQFGQIDLQSFTYLKYEKEQDKILLMEGKDKHFYSLSGLKASPTQGVSIEPLAGDFMKSNKMLNAIMTSQAITAEQQASIDLVNVYSVENSSGTYLGLVRTPDTIYNISLIETPVVLPSVPAQEGQQHQTTPIHSWKYGVASFKPIPNEYTDFSLIPGASADKFSDRLGFVAQNDSFIYHTRSPVLYRLSLAGDSTPKLAKDKSDLEKQGGADKIEPLYLFTHKEERDKARLVSAWGKRQDGVAQVVNKSSLLHRTPVGFLNVKDTLYLFEPVIGCVYILDGFRFGAIPKEGLDFTLTRVSIERFLKCPGSEAITYKAPYSKERCDTLENTEYFFYSIGPPTPPPPTLPPTTFVTTFGTNHSSVDEGNNTTNISGQSTLSSSSHHHEQQPVNTGPAAYEGPYEPSPTPEEASGAGKTFVIIFLILILLGLIGTVVWCLYFRKTGKKSGSSKKSGSKNKKSGGGKNNKSSKSKSKSKCKGTGAGGAKDTSKSGSASPSQSPSKQQQESTSNKKAASSASPKAVGAEKSSSSSSSATNEASKNNASVLSYASSSSSNSGSGSGGSSSTGLVGGPKNNSGIVGGIGSPKNNNSAIGKTASSSTTATGAMIGKNMVGGIVLKKTNNNNSPAKIKM